MTLDKILEILRKNRSSLVRKYGVKSLKVFGSYARSQQRKKSDLDILVYFRKPIDLFDFIEMEHVLSEKLGVKVDLVIEDSLKPRIRGNILNDAVAV